MENNLKIGLQNVNVYCKNNEFFLEITILKKDYKGDIHEIKVPGIKLDLFKYADYGLRLYDEVTSYDYETILRYCINTINHNYIVSDNANITDNVIYRHTERYTMEELEKKLGCHLEIVSNKENK